MVIERLGATPASRQQEIYDLEEGEEVLRHVPVDSEEVMRDLVGMLGGTSEQQNQLVAAYDPLQGVLKKTVRIGEDGQYRVTQALGHDQAVFVPRCLVLIGPRQSSSLAEEA